MGFKSNLTDTVVPEFNERNFKAGNAIQYDSYVTPIFTSQVDSLTQ